MEGRVNNILQLRDEDRLHWKGERCSFTLTTVSLPQTSVAVHREASPEPQVFPVGKELREDGQPATPSIWVALLELLLLSHTRGLRGFCRAQPLGI